MKGVQFLVSIVILAFAISIASDPGPLQDFCVAINDLKNGVFVNGKFCKDPKLTIAEDFFFSGLNIPGNTVNQVGSNITAVNVDTLPGLNTLGISLKSSHLNSHILGIRHKPSLKIKGVQFLVSIVILAFATSIASDPGPLQDFCVAINDLKNGVFVNGKFCKDPKLTIAEDFFFTGLNIPGNTVNQVGSNITAVNVDTLPGLNTLGISLVRID